ncbi:primosomal protein N' [Candidatus Igneacidithiobacillus taiwanensis]|uniref:primosomal protein N' n=1 Tax=Candidatus Igneacidithiobacillus taiwanensis TaxID=1945924 RepID=UPI0028972395|nr:primosomal protein N' [Candidatus Igneacidithiobacillus taiwanensis]MCE5360313.1 primosomal protein N' [Acidithiobacillus sp.]
MASEESCLEVVVFTPLPQRFSYRCALPLPLPGCRVRVPFGRGERVAIVVAAAPCPQDVAVKNVTAILDSAPLLPASLIQLLQFGSDYYHYPLGAVWAAALPTRLCQGHPVPLLEPQAWRWRADVALPTQGLGPRQRALAQRLCAGVIESSSLDSADRQRLRQFQAAGWVEPATKVTSLLHPGPQLEGEQAAAVAALRQARGFQAFLLDGVTGSGKTEVYLQAMEEHIANGRQVLFLVPEIGLVEQTRRRCAARFGAQRVAIYHSGQGDGERLRVWTQAREGEISILLGTRSALFVPLASPGLLVIDEEHDPSYKQQSGWLYSARDLALRRAQLERVPIVLGSATPALESLHNRATGRFTDLRLRQRATAHTPPRIEILPLRRKRLLTGLDPDLLQAAATQLAAGQQVLFFLNRRGYAPALLCRECGHIPHCRRCSAALTWHRRLGRLRCHHCGWESNVPEHCRQCGATEIHGIGVGTEGLEQLLRERFPDIPLLRVDRDEVHSSRQLAERLRAIQNTRPAILLGTQMLSKGHHFPDVTLVGIVDVDQGLYSADFRASERLAQTVIQVAGRAGRGDAPGRVLLQSYLPEHPLLQELQSGDYGKAAERLLQERQAAGLPPFKAIALLQAEAQQMERVQAFLQAARQHLRDLTCTGPLPALLERRAGFYRAYLWLESDSRVQLHRALASAREQIASLPAARRVRWGIDVDPQNF